MYLNVWVPRLAYGGSTEIQKNIVSKMVLGL